MSSFRNKMGLAAAAIVAAIGLAGTPAHAVVNSNALLSNALTTNALNPNALYANALTSNGVASTGSSLGELNGVAVEAVQLPEQR